MRRGDKCQGIDQKCDALLFTPPPPSPTQNAMAATFDPEYRKMLSTPVLSVTTVSTALA